MEKTMEKLTGRNVMYGDKPYFIEHTMINLENNEHVYYLRDGDKVIEVREPETNNIVLLNSYNDDVIDEHDVVDYNGEEYFVIGRLSLPRDRTKLAYKLQNVETKQYINVMDDEEIKKMRKNSF